MGCTGIMWLYRGYLGLFSGFFLGVCLELSRFLGLGIKFGFWVPRAPYPFFFEVLVSLQSWLILKKGTSLCHGGAEDPRDWGL